MMVMRDVRDTYNVSRTLEEFVEDLVSNGASPLHVRAVASQTRWRDKKYEAERLARELLKSRK
jgi:hypothetical protein